MCQCFQLSQYQLTVNVKPFQSMASPNTLEFVNAVYDVSVSTDNDVGQGPNNISETNRAPPSSDENDVISEDKIKNDNFTSTKVKIKNSLPAIPTNWNCMELLTLPKYNQSGIKTILKVATLLFSIILIVYLSTDIYLQNENSRKCKICGNPVTFPTFLGDLSGNICKEGKAVLSDFDCGKNTACFKLDVIHSEEWKKRADMMKGNLFQGGTPDHPMAIEPYINDGAFRGCMRGFFHWSGGNNCHFFNSTNIGHTIEAYNGWHSNETWFTTKICACTSDNCN